MQCTSSTKFLHEVLQRMPGTPSGVEKCVDYVMKKCCGSKCKPNFSYSSCSGKLRRAGDPLTVQCLNKFMQITAPDDETGRRLRNRGRRANKVVPLIDINQVRHREAMRQHAENQARGFAKKERQRAGSRKIIKAVGNAVGLMLRL